MHIRLWDWINVSIWMLESSTERPPSYCLHCGYWFDEVNGHWLSVKQPHWASEVEEKMQAYNYTQYIQIEHGHRGRRYGSTRYLLRPKAKRFDLNVKTWRWKWNNAWLDGTWTKHPMETRSACCSEVNAQWIMYGLGRSDFGYCWVKEVQNHWLRK